MLLNIPDILRRLCKIRLVSSENFPKIHQKCSNSYKFIILAHAPQVRATVQGPADPRGEDRAFRDAAGEEAAPPPGLSAGPGLGDCDDLGGAGEIGEKKKSPKASPVNFLQMVYNARTLLSSANSGR